jgi:hypothetical protein
MEDLDISISESEIFTFSEDDIKRSDDLVHKFNIERARKNISISYDINTEREPVDEDGNETEVAMIGIDVYFKLPLGYTKSNDGEVIKAKIDNVFMDLRIQNLGVELTFDSYSDKFYSIRLYTDTGQLYANYDSLPNNLHALISSFNDYEEDLINNIHNIIAMETGTKEQSQFLESLVEVYGLYDGDTTNVEIMINLDEDNIYIDFTTNYKLNSSIDDISYMFPSYLQQAGKDKDQEYFDFYDKIPRKYTKTYKWEWTGNKISTVLKRKTKWDKEENEYNYDLILNQIEYLYQHTPDLIDPDEGFSEEGSRFNKMLSYLISKKY